MKQMTALDKQKFRANMERFNTASEKFDQERARWAWFLQNMQFMEFDTSEFIDEADLTELLEWLQDYGLKQAQAQRLNETRFETTDALREAKLSRRK
jgi:hypothetical protein